MAGFGYVIYFMRIKIFFLALLLFLPQVSLAAEKVEIVLSANKTEVEVGERFEIALSLKRLSQGNEINLGSIPIPGLENFIESGSSQATNVSIVNGVSAVVYELKRTVAARSEGEYQIGPVKLQGEDGSGKVFEFESNTLTIKVEKGNESDKESISAKSDTKDKDEKGLGRGLTNALIALVGISFFLYMRGGNFRDLVDTKILKKTEIEADSREVSTVSVRTLPDIEDNDFYAKVSSAIRSHLEKDDKGAKAVMTTAELVAWLKESRHYRAGEIEEVLKACDGYRYAKAESDRVRIIELSNKILRS
jgi:hypothetical protein